MDAIPDSTTTPTKKCNKCGRVLPATLEFFAHKERGRYGVSAICRPCLAQRERQRRATDPTIKEKDRLRNKNPGRVAWKRQYMQKYTRTTKYRKWDNERNKERRKRPEYIAAEKRRKAGARYRQRFSEYRKNYSKTAKGRAVELAAWHRRSARLRDLPTTFTANDWQRAVGYFDGKCAVCGRPPGLWHTLAADHWIPLTNPECPGTVPWNIVPLCHQLDGCNNHKGAKDPLEWLVEKLGEKEAVKVMERITAYFEAVRDDE